MLQTAHMIPVEKNLPIKKITSSREKKNHLIPHSSRIWISCQLPGPACQMWGCHNCFVSSLILPVRKERLSGTHLSRYVWVCAVCVCIHMQSFLDTCIHRVYKSTRNVSRAERKQATFTWNTHLCVFSSFWMKCIFVNVSWLESRISGFLFPRRISKIPHSSENEFATLK